MAEAPNRIFNERAVEKLRSPDDLDKYVQVTNPNVWVVLIAILALLAGLLAWGVFGSVTTSVDATGTCVNGKAMCFLNAETFAEVDVGDVAVVGGERMRVAEISSVPYSLDEVHAEVGSDYLVEALVDGAWGYRVIFEGDTSGLNENVPLSVTITVERIAPITLVLGGQV